MRPIRSPGPRPMRRLVHPAPRRSTPDRYLSDVVRGCHQPASPVVPVGIADCLPSSSTARPSNAALPQFLARWWRLLPPFAGLPFWCTPVPVTREPAVNVDPLPAIPWCRNKEKLLLSSASQPVLKSGATTSDRIPPLPSRTTKHLLGARPSGRAPPFGDAAPA